MKSSPTETAPTAPTAPTTLTAVRAPTAPSESAAPTAPTALGENTAPSAPSAPGKRKRRTATGPLKNGRARPGTVEYEVFRSQSKGGHPYPWRKLDATAERKIECTSRANSWEYEVLRYVAAREHMSISKFVLEHAVRAALLKVLQYEAGDDEEQGR